MRAIKTIRRLLGLESDRRVHQSRLKSVFFAVEALVRGGRLSLTSIGRSALGAVAPKHSIKRIDRLLGNEFLHKERLVFAEAIAHLLVGQGLPIILVDWTKLSDQLYALVAASPFAGRGVPIYAEVHQQKHHGTPKVEKAFLARLAKAIPEGVRPIIVTDAGYRNPWFEAVARLGWDYLGRLQGSVHVLTENAWGRADQVPSARKPIDHGFVPVAKTARSRAVHRLIVARPKKRPKRVERRSKLDRQSIQERKQRAKANWVLVTSLTNETPKRLTQLYAIRMEIEETFRDIKSARFGWSMEFARTNNPRRYEILILLASLATLLVLIVGLAAEERGWQRNYQANTIKNRRVLSLYALGRRVLDRSQGPPINYKTAAKLIEKLFAEPHKFVGIP